MLDLCAAQTIAVLHNFQGLQMLRAPFAPKRLLWLCGLHVAKYARFHDAHLQTEYTLRKHIQSDAHSHGMHIQIRCASKKMRIGTHTSLQCSNSASGAGSSPSSVRLSSFCVADCLGMCCSPDGHSECRASSGRAFNGRLLLIPLEHTVTLLLGCPHR